VQAVLIVAKASNWWPKSSWVHTTSSSSAVTLIPHGARGRLETKELTYLHAEGYPGGELKHGPLALIEPGVVVIAIATDPAMHEKMLSNLSEVKARGASVVAVANG